MVWGRRGNAAHGAVGGWFLHLDYPKEVLNFMASALGPVLPGPLHAAHKHNVVRFHAAPLTVAQFGQAHKQRSPIGRASVLSTEGCGFKSRRAPHRLTSSSDGQNHSPIRPHCGPVQTRRRGRFAPFWFSSWGIGSVCRSSKAFGRCCGCTHDIVGLGAMSAMHVENAVVCER